MAFGEKLAEKIAKALDAVGYPCSLEGCTVSLPGPNMKVVVLADEPDSREPGKSVGATIVTQHKAFTHGASYELSVGSAESLEASSDTMAASWMLVYFPVVKKLLSPGSDDGTVAEETTPLPGKPGEEGRLILGPVQMILYTKAPSGELEGPDLRVLWEMLREKALEELGPGVHHLRVFIAVTREGVTCDVFVNGKKWEAGGLELHNGAGQLPEIPEACYGYGLKQHIIISPEDVDEANREQREAEQAGWMKALEDRPEVANDPGTADVLKALSVMATPMSESEKVEALIGDGISPLLAEDLVTFVPSAAVRCFYGEKVRFAEVYFRANRRSEQAVERRYDQTPVFMLALRVCDAMLAAEAGVEEVGQAAQTSAEYQLIGKLITEGQNLADAVFQYSIHWTSEPIKGADVKALMEAFDKANNAENKANETKEQPKRPWWKFW